MVVSVAWQRGSEPVYLLLKSKAGLNTDNVFNTRRTVAVGDRQEEMQRRTLF
jgi:hypothetical protein